MSTAPVDISALDDLSAQQNRARMQQFTQQVPLPEPSAPPSAPTTVRPATGSIDDLQQQATLGRQALGSALQNQQQQYGQAQNDLRAQAQLSDPYQKIQQDLADRYQQLSSQRHLRVKGLLQNFFSGMAHGMLPVQQTPEFQRNQIIGQMINLENARSMEGLRQAQTANLQTVERTLPDGTSIQLPLSQAARYDAAIGRGELSNQKPGSLDDQIGRLVYGDLQAGRDPNQNPQIKSLLQLRSSMQKPQADTQLANREQYQTTVGKLAAAGLPTDPKSLPASFATGLKRGIISQQEHADAMGYQAANQTPSTSLQVHVEGAGAGKPATLEPQYIGFNPQTGQREMLPASQARAVGMQGAMLAKEGDVDKYSTAQSQFNDVQTNVSRYVTANSAYNQLPTWQRAKDAAALNTILNKAGIFDLKVSLGAGGSVEIPGLSAALEAASREANSAAYNAMSPEAKDLMNGYLRTMAAVPAFVKALTNVGRTNKEIMDLELANIPNPTMTPADIARKMQAFQENIDVAVKRLTRIPGIETTQDIRRQFEPQSRPNHVKWPRGDFYRLDRAVLSTAQGFCRIRARLCQGSLASGSSWLLMAARGKGRRTFLQIRHC